MDYTMQANYNQFLLNMMMEEADMEQCIREAVIISEGVNVQAELTSLNEGVGDKIKEVWGKFTAFIKRIFAKFSEAMNKVLDTDKGYLEKYQSIILKKPFKLEVKCRDYQLDRVAAVKVEVFNYSQIKSSLIRDGKPSKAAYMHHYFSNFGEDSGTEDLGGWCKAHFCNGEEEKEFKTMNMTDIYNFCHDFSEKTLPKLKDDENNISKSATNANSLIVSAINTAKSAESAKADEERAAAANKEKENAAGNNTGGTSGTTGGDNSQGQQTQHNSAIITSKLLGRVLSEMEVKAADGAKPAASKTDAATGSSDKKFSSNAPGITGDKETSDSAAKVVSGDTLTEEKVRDIIDTYSAVAGAIASSKITVSEWAYKDYMKIIRAHVKMYAGDDSTPDQVAAPTTDYRPPVGAPNKRDDGGPLQDGDAYTDPNGQKYTWKDKVKQWVHGKLQGAADATAAK